MALKDRRSADDDLDGGRRIRRWMAPVASANARTNDWGLQAQLGDPGLFGANGEDGQGATTARPDLVGVGADQCNPERVHAGR